jgi:hypothetical protein
MTDELLMNDLTVSGENKQEDELNRFDDDNRLIGAVSDRTTEKFKH